MDTDKINYYNPLSKIIYPTCKTEASMPKITNFHQHDHWNHNPKYFFFPMNLTPEDDHIVSSFVIKDATSCEEDPSQKICDVIKKVFKPLGYELSDLDVLLYVPGDGNETDWHTDMTCRTDQLNKFFKASDFQTGGKLFYEAYKLLEDCYSNKASYTCSISLRGDKTVISSVDIKYLTEDCQESDALDEKECRKQFEHELVKIPDGYGICFSSETIHRGPGETEETEEPFQVPNENGRIAVFTETGDVGEKINKFLSDNYSQALDSSQAFNDSDISNWPA